MVIMANISNRKNIFNTMTNSNTTTTSSSNTNSNGNTNSSLKIGFYDIGEVIGEGNFATVRLAKHRYTKTDVAIKIIDKTKLSKSDLDKVNREIQIMNLLSHPNIIKLYQVMKTENLLCLVTEYAPNGELFDYIVKNGKLSESEARKKFWQILSAIEYCHKCRVVHRDLKAENLLLDANGNIKIADFGFGNQFSDGDKLATFCGSPPYAAPELFEGKTYKGPEVDIWSLGVVLYVLVCGGLPFYGENLKDLKDRVLKGIFRIPFWMSQDCEHLIRRMLVHDPEKRHTIDQIKKHRWLLLDGPLKPIVNPQSAHILAENNSSCLNGSEEIYNEHVLRQMDQLGLERQKTLEQLSKSSVYDHYTAIYHLLLDRSRLHRSSFPLEKQPDLHQQRRPSAVADNALNHTKYLQQLHQASLHHNQLQAEMDCSNFKSMLHTHYPHCTTNNILDGHMVVAGGSGGGGIHSPLSNSASYDTTYSTSAESGLEVDMETDLISARTFTSTNNSKIPSKPPLARRHTLTGMTGIPSPEAMLRTIGGPSIDSGHSMELPSESPSIESNLDFSEYNFEVGSGEGLPMPHSDMAEALLQHRINKNAGSCSTSRQHTRSPINFREGRRASDGLVCQDVIAFRQKLKDGMKAGGMLELRQEHTQLLESYSGDMDNSANLPMEPPVKIPLGKRMSLPTNTIDLPPHRLLEIKQSIQLDQNLAVSQDISAEAPRPFGPLQHCDATPHIHHFGNHHPLPRQYRPTARKQNSYKSKHNTAFYQHFQQLHIDPSGLGRGGKHPAHAAVSRQPSYKQAQHQAVYPAAFDSSAVVTALPWESTANSNFLCQIVSTCSGDTTSPAFSTSTSTALPSSIDSTCGILQPHPLTAYNPTSHQCLMDSDVNNMYFNN